MYATYGIIRINLLEPSKPCTAPAPHAAHAPHVASGDGRRLGCRRTPVLPVNKHIVTFAIVTVTHITDVSYDNVFVWLII